MQLYFTETTEEKQNRLNIIKSYYDTEDTEKTKTVTFANFQSIVNQITNVLHKHNQLLHNLKIQNKLMQQHQLSSITLDFNKQLGLDSHKKQYEGPKKLTVAGVAPLKKKNR